MTRPTLAQAQGDRAFVEAAGTVYVVDGVRPLPDNRVIVATTVDQPELVGYGQVQFLSLCTGGDIVLLGGYVPIDGTVELLFATSEGEAAGDLPRQGSSSLVPDSRNALRLIGAP